MKITITPLATGATAVTLCEGDARATDGTPAGPIDLSGAFQPGAVDREYVDADGIEPEHVGCDRASLRFGVMRTFATPALASAAAVGLRAAVPQLGAVAIDAGAYMARAKCTYSFGQVGCSLSILYTLEGY